MEQDIIFCKEVLPMNTAKKSLVLGILVFLGLLGNAVAEEKTAEAKMEIQQVSLFKNGLGFFVSEAAIPEKVKHFNIFPDPPASHGTFWISYPPKVDVESVVASQ